MTKRDLRWVAALAVVVGLITSCTAAQVAQDVALGKELPCGPAVSADGDWDVGSIPDNVVITRAEIDALLSEPPATEFDLSEPILAVNEGNAPLVLGAAWPIEVNEVTPQELSPGQCSFTVTLSEAGLATFNQMARLCFEQTPQCPTGQLAILADGQLIWAPAIMAPNFDQPEFVITSPSPATPDESLLVTKAIAGDAQFRPVIFDPLAP